MVKGLLIFFGKGKFLVAHEQEIKIQIEKEMAIIDQKIALVLKDEDQKSVKCVKDQKADRGDRIFRDADALREEKHGKDADKRDQAKQRKIERFGFFHHDTSEEY